MGARKPSAWSFSEPGSVVLATALDTKARAHREENLTLYAKAHTDIKRREFLLQ